MHKVYQNNHTYFVNRYLQHFLDIHKLHQNFHFYNKVKNFHFYNQIELCYTKNLVYFGIFYKNKFILMFKNYTSYYNLYNLMINLLNCSFNSF